MVLGVFIWGQIYGQRGTDLWSKGDRFSVDNFFIHRLWITFKRFDLDSLLIRIGLVIYITFSVFCIDVLLGMDSHLIYHLPTLNWVVGRFTILMLLLFKQGTNLWFAHLWG
ncbi:hypothetical protein ABNG94_RS22800, partial [Escherichia coli]